MQKYIIRRILIAIPTLFIISFIVFMLCAMSPTEPAKMKCTGAGGQISEEFNDCVAEQRKRWNHHLPLFYIGLASLAEPDTLYRIPLKYRRKMLARLTHMTGDWKVVESYHAELMRFYKLQFQLRKESVSADTIAKVLQSVKPLMDSWKPTAIEAYFQDITTLYETYPSLNPYIPQLNQLKEAKERLFETRTSWKNYVPKIIVYGTENQYHKWVSGIITRLDFGRMYGSNTEVSRRIWDRLFWTIMLSLFSALIIYVISIPLGVMMGVYQDSLFDRMGMSITFGLRSIPSFWFASLLILFFANPDMLDWFPSTFNIIPDEGDSLWMTFWTNLYRLVLPLIAYTYGAFAFLSRTMRMSILENIHQDYIRTARAKGVPENRVFFKHALRNSLLPIITIFSNIFPGLISGSIILENIFQIPGLGKEIVNAVFANDTPYIMAIALITGVLTVIGYLFADIMYAIADPRIRYRKN